jgi:hypothetical protein
VERVLARFVNPRPQDDVEHVDYQTLRKLAKGDHLLGPTAMVCRAVALGITVTPSKPPARSIPKALRVGHP